MVKTAIMIDGGFFLARVDRLWKDQHDPKLLVKNLMAYCEAHLAIENPKAELYRIFYYDCAPLNCAVYHPFNKRQVNLGMSASYQFRVSFQRELLRQRKVALRLGRLVVDNEYVIRPEVARKLWEGSIEPSQIQSSDFYPLIRQKGVDMKLGIDIASVAYKRQVNQIVLIAGDSDFVPAAKIARREGIDFILDPMGNHINAELEEHIDGERSPVFTPSTIHPVSRP